MIWDWAYAWEILPVLGYAAIVTIKATIAGYLVALVGGLALALMRRSPIRALAWPTAVFVEFVRSTPLLVQLFFLFFGLPELGIKLSPFATGVLGLGLHFSTYTSEVYRAGIDGVARGQWEAGKALNFSTYRRYRAVVLPQAIPPIVPVLGNYLLTMFKDSTLLSAIAVKELLQMAKIIGSDTFRYMEPLTIVGVFFIVMSVVSATGISWLERKLNPRRSA
ncbi:MAG: ectoine/hydroxyectoine ABC transporter permease subunit EhuD [Proteobacteria bacterium]|nr:ectoine/hydroxyectoine ABC transporter permease subunit EhuD [Pseudomonadota bacterium]